jgi:hypothetical protein
MKNNYQIMPYYIKSFFGFIDSPKVMKFDLIFDFSKAIDMCFLHLSLLTVCLKCLKFPVFEE